MSTAFAGVPGSGRRAGDALVHPVPLLAIAVLLVNDHVLKSAFPGPITGKLSDVAGLVFAPLLLVGLVEVVAAAITRRPRVLGARVVVVAVALVGVGFALAKTTPAGADAFRTGLGWLQWAPRALAAIVGGAPPPVPMAVSFVADATDLVALPALLVALVLGRARARDARSAEAAAPAR